MDDSLDQTQASCRGGGQLRVSPGWTVCTGQEGMAADKNKHRIVNRVSATFRHLLK